jgi:hypothetical protein
MAVVFVFVRGKTLISIVDTAKPWTSGDYIEFGTLLAILLAAIVAINALRRDRSARRLGGLPVDKGLVRGASFRDTLRQLPEIVRKAFDRHPVLSSLLSLVLAFIPAGLVAMGRRDGLHAFEPHDWMLAGVMEIPMTIVVAMVLASFRSHRRGSR